jgi:hypothetical protein
MTMTPKNDRWLSRALVTTLAVGGLAQACTLPDDSSDPGQVSEALGGSVRFVQVAAATPQGAVSTVRVRFRNPQGAGDLNLVAVGWNDTTAPPVSVSDTLGNSYAQVGTTHGQGLSQTIYLAPNIHGGANSVTVTFGSAVSYPDVRVLEYGGLATSQPLDAIQGATGSGARASSQNLTTTSANDLIVGLGMTAGAFSGAGGGFRARVVTAPDGDIAEDRTGATAGAYAATAPLAGSAAWLMQAVALRAATSAPGGSDAGSDAAPIDDAGVPDANPGPVDAGPPGTSAFLLDSYGGATVLLSMTKENRDYSGPCVRVSRANGSSPIDIPFVAGGKNIDAAVADAYLAGGTAFGDVWYGQSNGQNAVQPTLSRRWQFVKRADGKYSFKATANGLGMELADNAVFKTPKVHLFMIWNGGNYPADASENGAFIGYTGPGAINDNARWALGNAYAENDVPGKYVVNGTTSYWPMGAAHLRSNTGGGLVTWDFSTEDQQLRINNGHVVVPGSGSTNVTYPSAQKLIIGNGADYASSQLGEWTSVILYGTTRTDRDAISAYLNSPASSNLADVPWTYTLDGFNFKAEFSPTWEVSSPDANGFSWWQEFGGYDWSFSRATTSNGAELVRYGVHGGDSDWIVTGAERAERGASGIGLSKGDSWERFFQFYVEPGASMDIDWCGIGQMHYNNGGFGSPAIFFLSMLHDQVTVESGTVVSTPVAYSRGTWYALRISGTWSPNSTADTLQVWLGPNGTALTKIVDAKGALFENQETGAYFKQGIYRGYSSPDPFVVRVANDKISKTAGAFTAYVSSQPVLPQP